MRKFLEKGAPILIIILICIFVMVWTVGGFIGGAFGAKSILLGGVFLVAGLCVVAALIVTLVKRLKEIDQEDEDDLKKY